MKLDYAAVRASDEIRTYITQADASLIAMGYTEHSFAHVAKCAETAAGLLSQLGYDERQVEGAVVLGAAMKLMGLDAAAQQEPTSRMESGLKTLFASVNHGVLEATNGLLDARMLAGGVLTVAAVRSMKLYGAAVPGAMTLLWWAASIFRRGINGAD